MKKRIFSTLISLLFISTISISQIAAKNKTDGENPYFTVEQVTLPDGTQLEKDTISGPSTPPLELARPTVNPDTNGVPGDVILTAPAFSWYMGCSATSGAMIAGYWDRNGYPNMYTGPTNGGVMPLDNSSWSTFADVDGGTYRVCPLTGSRNGFDGRVTRGSSDDYWYSYLTGHQDPFVTNGWTEHTWGTAIGDYMKTSQYSHGNDDGSTSFYSFNSSSQLTCTQMEGYVIQNEDGTYGRKLFYQARGYTVTDCYAQKTDNMYSGGFSFAQYMAEINAGRPVMINLQGHTIVGVGYNPSGNTVYVHDTWDYSTHSMTWGGCYSTPTMCMRTVSIVNLVVPLPGAFAKSAPANATYQPTSPTLTWGASSGATSYEYCFDTNNNNLCDTSWFSVGNNTSILLGGFTNNVTYYWQIRAVNGSGNTLADGGTWWSFTARNQRFADVPIDHQFWAYIEAMYNSGVTTGCGTGPLIYCPDSVVTRASMAVFLLRAKYGSSYAPPASTHTFSDLPVAGKEWQEAWVNEFYSEGITSGCGTGPLIYCPENPVTRAAMAVFILRTKYGASYTPPAASHFFSDMPVVGKEWMEPFVDEVYREGITTGCGTGPLIYCPESSVKRQAMAAFLTRAFSLPMP